MQAEKIQNDLTRRAGMLLRAVEAEFAGLARQADEAYHDLLAQWQSEGGAGSDGVNSARNLELRLAESRRAARQLSLLVQLHQDLVNELEGREATPSHGELKADLPRIRLIQSQEESYLRIARELRNGIGQIMANAVLELEYFEHLSGTDAASALGGLQSLKEEIRVGFKDLQRFIEDLGPPPLLSELGLSASLNRYVENFREEMGLEVRVDIAALPTNLPPTMEIAIFRIVQEALLNIRKHAQSSVVEVRVYRQNGELIVSIADDGRGFKVEPRDQDPSLHLGLILMRDRADLMGGRLQIRNREEKGTEVFLSVPYQLASMTPERNAVGGKAP